MKKFVAAVSEVSHEIRDISDFIHKNPEIGFEEYKASAIQTAFLKRHGFEVSSPQGGLDTAFKAVWESGYSADPIRFCFMSEYDALQGLGHACGHNLICAAALAAVYVAKKELESRGIDAALYLMGTPGEEGKGGKVKMIEGGSFKDIEAGLICHPYDVTSMDIGCLSLSRYTVTFQGRAAHASMGPEKGINALDAMIQLFNGIALWRQQLPESSRVHGIITHGGDAANIIPDRTEAFFYVRANNTQTRKMMESRFEDIARGAAAATGCTVDIKWVSSYKSSVFNSPFNAEYSERWKYFGANVEKATGTEARLSSDFGDVSQLFPSANLFFGITASPEIPLHSIEFREAAASDYAFEQAMRTAAIMASMCVKYYTDHDFRDHVLADFAGRKKIESDL